MNESSTATVLVDSSGNGLNGDIGPNAVTGATFDGATAHRFLDRSTDVAAHRARAARHGAPLAAVEPRLAGLRDHGSVPDVEELRQPHPEGPERHRPAATSRSSCPSGAPPACSKGVDSNGNSCRVRSRRPTSCPHPSSRRPLGAEEQPVAHDPLRTVARTGHLVHRRRRGEPQGRGPPATSPTTSTSASPASRTATRSKPRATTSSATSTGSASRRATVASPTSRHRRRSPAPTARRRACARSTPPHRATTTAASCATTGTSVTARQVVSETDAATSHTYTTGGSKTVRLTVTDDDGAMDDTTRSFSVTVPTTTTTTSTTTTTTIVDQQGPTVIDAVDGAADVTRMRWPCDSRPRHHPDLHRRQNRPARLFVTGDVAPVA